MLQLVIGSREYYDEEKEEFINIKGQTLQLEHSLVSISKWESKWHKAFLGKDEKTSEMMVDYIKCMTITQNVNDDVYLNLSEKNFEEINKYIDNPMSATWFSEDGTNKVGSSRGETITSELIYYWMVALQIPVEFQKWHLNRLLTLIKVCNIKNAPAKKMTKREIMNRNRSLNEARKAALNSRG